MPLLSSTLREAMRSVSDAEILDIVRKLRQYLATLDNCHSVLDNLSRIEEESIKVSVTNLIPEIIGVSKKTSIALKSIENSRPYREMLKRFNIQEDSED